MENLRILRKQHNLSQQKLADILHISQQSVYKYENDITFPDIETLIRMADYFNTSLYSQVFFPYFSRNFQLYISDK